MSRQLWDLPGGIHPPGNKDQSSETSIKVLPIPPELVVPLQQHIGTAPKLIVAVGQTVLKGEPIAQASGFVSVPVHAPTSGVITAIEPRPVQHPSQMDALSVVIASDSRDQWVEHAGLDDYQQHSKADVLEKIRAAGITGMGGAGFPTVVKLSIHTDQKIQQLIINAVECEPYITADDRLMRERAAQIIAGIEILAWLTEPEEVLIGIEDNKPQAIKAMQAAIGSKKMSLVVVPTKYPSGGEKQLIYMLTGKEVRSGGIPADVGVVCQNVGTAYAVQRAIHHGEPLISRITTVTGDCVRRKGNYEVLVGTPVDWLLAQAEATPDKVERLILGGPMMGFAAHSLKIPVVKTTNCLLVPSHAEFPEPAPEQPCIRCGSCAQVCPVNLLPQQLYWFSKAKEFDKASHYNLADCIECGACAYVCPSQIPLVQYYRFAKGEIRTQEQENQKSDHARIRFEARKARLEREEQEKERKRQERAQAAAAKQAQKKAEPISTQEATITDTAKLQTAAASAMKRYKEAQKALAQAEKNGAENIAALQQKVEQLKTKAETAKQALKETQQNSKAESNTTTSAGSIATPVDPIAALKIASATDFAAYQAAKAELDTAENCDPAQREALQLKVAELKAKSDASKLAMKEARAQEKADIQARNAAAEDPIKTLKMEVAKQQVMVKKAHKALAAAAPDSGQKEALSTAVNSAETALKAAEDALAKAQGDTQ